MPDHPTPSESAAQETILDFLKEIAREELELSEEQLEQMDLDTPLMEGFRLDSVTQVVLITAIEDHYGIQFELEDGEGLRTVRDLVGIIEERIRQKRASRH